MSILTAVTWLCVLTRITGFCRLIILEPIFQLSSSGLASAILERRPVHRSRVQDLSHDRHLTCHQTGKWPLSAQNLHQRDAAAATGHETWPQIGTVPKLSAQRGRFRDSFHRYIRPVHLNIFLFYFKFGISGWKPYIYNQVYDTVPLIIQTQGGTQAMHKVFGNYIPDGWNPVNGCLRCLQNTINLKNRKVFLQHHNSIKFSHLKFDRGRKNASRRMWTGTELRNPLRNFAEKNTRHPECDLVHLYFFS